MAWSCSCLAQRSPHLVTQLTINISKTCNILTVPHAPTSRKDDEFLECLDFLSEIPRQGRVLLIVTDSNCSKKSFKWRLLAFSKFCEGSILQIHSNELPTYISVITWAILEEKHITDTSMHWNTTRDSFDKTSLFSQNGKLTPSQPPDISMPEITHLLLHYFLLPLQPSSPPCCLPETLPYPRYPA